MGRRQGQQFEAAIEQALPLCHYPALEGSQASSAMSPVKIRQASGGTHFAHRLTHSTQLGDSTHTEIASAKTSKETIMRSSRKA